MADAASTLPDRFTLDLISPEARLISRPVWQVVCPGVEGEFGVRAGHMPLLSALKNGVVVVQDAPHAPAEIIFVAGGFADVTPAQLTLLAEEAVPVSSLQIEALNTAVDALHAQINVAENDIAAAPLRKALGVIQAKQASLALVKTA
ncbi:MAG: ATP synthase F1 subunit epsilon [Pseudomonadota bacterium]